MYADPDQLKARPAQAHGLQACDLTDTDELYLV